MTHLTHTGFYAGTPLCQCDREAAEDVGDRFVHATYASHEVLTGDDTCDACKDVWQGLEE